MRSNGYRRRTRQLFRKGQREHGAPGTSKIMQQFRIGDLVDIKVDSSVVKGMPHKYFHGKTGRVFNINRRAVGIILYRKVGHKFIERHVNARVEHLTLSRSNEDMKRRYAEYEKLLAEARKEGREIKPVKRVPKGPLPAFSVSMKDNTPIEVAEKKHYVVY